MSVGLLDRSANFDPIELPFWSPFEDVVAPRLREDDEATPVIMCPPDFCQRPSGLWVFAPGRLPAAATLPMLRHVLACQSSPVNSSTLSVHWGRWHPQPSLTPPETTAACNPPRSISGDSTPLIPVTSTKCAHGSLISTPRNTASPTRNSRPTRWPSGHAAGDDVAPVRAGRQLEGVVAPQRLQHLLFDQRHLFLQRPGEPAAGDRNGLDERLHRYAGAAGDGGSFLHCSLPRRRLASSRSPACWAQKRHDADCVWRLDGRRGEIGAAKSTAHLDPGDGE